MHNYSQTVVSLMALRPRRIGIWKCWFLWREENPRSKDENEQQTQPTYDSGTGNRTQATLVEGECSHHCAIPATPPPPAPGRPWAREWRDSAEP